LIESGLRELAGVSNVEARSGELTVSAVNGAGVIADVAVALKGSGITVQTLTLRTPTLDDVFLQVTGAHLAESHKSTGDDTEGTAS
jgi:ABC-2 type transport system ATP-binding protein